MAGFLSGNPLVDLGSVVGGLAVAGTIAYHMSRPSPPDFGFDLQQQSKIKPGTEDGERIHCSARYGTTLLHKFEDSETLFDVFEHGEKINPDGPCMGWRPSADEGYTFLTYKQARKQALDLGSGLVALGVPPGQESFVGIFAQNRVEWVIAEQACNAHSMVTVPLYETLGDEAVRYIISQTELRAVVCEPSKFDSIMDAAPHCLKLKHIIMIGKPTEVQVTEANELSITLKSFDDVIALGQKSPSPVHKPKASDIATICYTSGTTGMPKGAILTHQNMVADAGGAYAVIAGAVEFGKDDVHISYLPLAHMFERLIHVLIFQRGASMGFFRGDVKVLLDDIKTLQPTIFPSVPRLLNRVYDKVLAGVDEAGGVKKMLFNTALASKSAEVKRGIIRNDSIWDRIVFKKIQATLGGRVRMVVTGAAPIHSRVLDFLRCALGCHVFEGYGQTESSAAATVTLPGDTSPGHVGPPLPCNEIKLADIPEMDYYAKDGKGEICFRGPNVFQGYYKNKEKTDETLDSEGWLHSGDVGQWTPEGTIKIIDRKKHIFKLAQGEYIAPEKIENIYMRHPAMAQCYVHGESLRSRLVGVFFPDEESFEPWAKSKGFSGSRAELCRNADLKKLVLAEVTELGKKGGLKSFEQVKNIELFPEIMSVANGLLTPTFKAKRPVIKKKFADTINAMYKALGED